VKDFLDARMGDGKEGVDGFFRHFLERGDFLFNFGGV